MYPRADRHDTGPAGDLQHSGAAAEKAGRALSVCLQAAEPTLEVQGYSQLKQAENNQKQQPTLNAVIQTKLFCIKGSVESHAQQSQGQNYSKWSTESLLDVLHCTASES